MTNKKKPEPVHSIRDRSIDLAIPRVVSSRGERDEHFWEDTAPQRTG
jgi:hypothetical protein